MNKKIFGLAALAVAIVCSFAFNKPATLKDVSCSEDGKVWFVYNGTTAVVEDSNNAGQITQAKTPANYSRLVSLDDCSGEQLLCAICAFPQAGAPTRPQIAGQPVDAEITNFVTAGTPHSPSLIVEKE